jgi:hypothetical protein
VSKTLRTYLPQDRASVAAARAFDDGLDAAGASGRAVADELGCDEKTVRNLRAGVAHVRLHHLVQIQSATAFEEIVDALRAEREKIYGTGLRTSAETASACLGGACNRAVQVVLDALRDGRVSDEERAEIERAVVDVKRHARALSQSRGDA